MTPVCLLLSEQAMSAVMSFYGAYATAFCLMKLIPNLKACFTNTKAVAVTAKIAAVTLVVHTSTLLTLTMNQIIQKGFIYFFFHFSGCKTLPCEVYTVSLMALRVVNLKSWSVSLLVILTPQNTHTHTL